MSIENTIKETNELNNKLLNAIHLYRLNYDLRVLLEELEKNKQENVSTKSNIFEKAAKNIKNEIKSNKSDKLQKNLDETKELLKEQNNKDISYDDLLKLFNKSFKDNELSKLLFSISLVIEEKEYFYDEQSESTISMMLWEDVSYLENLKNNFKTNYIKISSTNITSNKHILLGASACASFVTSLSVNASFLDNLAVNVKSDKSSTIGALIALGLSKDTNYETMKTVNKEQLKSEFSKLSLEEVSYIYTIKSLVAEYVIKNLDKTTSKNYLNDLLLLTNDLRANCLYSALVNKVDVDSNEKLIDVFYRFEKDLLKKHCS